MITVRVTNALGNQLFQYSCARRLSIFRGTKLEIDTTWYSAPGRIEIDNLGLRHFVLSPEVSFGERTNVNIGGRIWHPFQHVLKQSKAYDDRVLTAGPRTYLIGWWQDHRYFSDVSTQIRQELQPSDPLSSHVEDLVNCVAYEQSVSLHVRHAGYPWPLPASYFNEAISKVARLVANPQFYVFSDDLEWVRRSIELPRSAVLVDWLPQDHPWCDLWLMSQCRHHIMSNSTFSYWGAWLASAPDGVVVAPSIWHFDDRIFPLPEHWTVI